MLYSNRLIGTWICTKPRRTSDIQKPININKAECLAFFSFSTIWVSAFLLGIGGEGGRGREAESQPLRYCLQTPRLDPPPALRPPAHAHAFLRTLRGHFLPAHAVSLLSPLSATGHFQHPPSTWWLLDLLLAPDFLLVDSTQLNEEWGLALARDCLSTSSPRQL